MQCHSEAGFAASARSRRRLIFNVGRKMKYYSGGFLVIVPAPRPGYMDRSIIPDPVVTPSACITEAHPSDSAVSWSSQSAEKRKAWREELGITKLQESEIHRTTDKWFEEGRIGRGGIFYEFEDSIEYSQKYTGKAEVLVIEIGTTDVFASEFIEEFGVKREKEVENTLVRALKMKRPISKKSQILGYDILGFETGGRFFHSFMCNSLETDYRDKLGLRFSEHGLVSDFEGAVKASAYNNDPDVGAEPVLWQPWIVCHLNSNKPQEAHGHGKHW